MSSSSSATHDKELNDMFDRLVTILMGMQAELDEMRARLRLMEEAQGLTGQVFH